ncbi:OVARIAN TUMOR DOMAIN-containing deubiquitinating enzyme 7-like isoform X2 [Apium graveolens]|uniref:OVARIAN TUMOR DOMAIN-containing deubiquitinating enzyme 7-like isoform X2 n=1 Tax=Apium graveolens TaxID=4045 RepID=UPI003D78D5E2
MEALKMSPRWHIQNFDNRDAQMIYLSYHDEEHYNSVRVKEDTCVGASRPVIIKMIPSRNKACPGGSKKKYKSCCRVVAGRSSPRFMWGLFLPRRWAILV